MSAGEVVGPVPAAGEDTVTEDVAVDSSNGALPEHASTAAPAQADPERRSYPDRPIVLGAGPAGLSAAWALRRAGASPVVLERTEDVCGNWRRHYDSLRLNTPRRLSSLPGMLMDRKAGRWVARKDVVAYNERYARRFAPDIRFGVEARRIERDGGGWRVDTSDGDYWSPRVVVALGLNALPAIPPWPGRDGFEGQLLHALEYQSPEPFRGRDVLVVGLGASGTDIAVELARGGANRVWVSVRTPPLIYRRHISTALLSQLIKEGRRPPRKLVDASGVAVHRLLWGDLSRYGLPNPTEGLATALETRGHGSTVDRGFVDALKKAELAVVPAVERFDGRDVVLVNGTLVRADLVICATGQRPNLDPLVGHLGVLQENGRPKVHGAGTAPEAPGLHFLGYRLPAGQLLDMRIDAPAIARSVARVLR